jgi:hypothetical protein
VTSQSSISEEFHEGDTIVLDLRHDFLKKDTAMALFTVLMEAFQKSRARDGEEFNRDCPTWPVKPASR